MRISHCTARGSYKHELARDSSYCPARPSRRRPQQGCDAAPDSGAFDPDDRHPGWHWAFRSGLEHYADVQHALRESIVESAALERLLVPLISLIRAELELPFETESYARIIEEGHRQVTDYLDAYIQEMAPELGIDAAPAEDVARQHSSFISQESNTI
jgi:hypothetical protein